MLGGKAGLVHVHMGTGEAQLQPLYDALEASNVPIAQFLPTHMERNPSLVNEAKRWIEHCGYVDFTAGAKVKLCNAIWLYLQVPCMATAPHPAARQVCREGDCKVWLHCGHMLLASPAC